MRKRTMRRMGILFAIMLLPVFVVSATMLLGSDHSSRLKMRAVTVAPGDTLWELAERYGPPDRDLRETVDGIYRANRMTSTRLVAGQRLLIPVPH